MKTLFFLVMIANVTLFMWEYKQGAIASKTETSSQSTNNFHENIVLLSELPPALQQNQALAVKESAAHVIKVPDSKIIFFPKNTEISEPKKVIANIATQTPGKEAANIQNATTEQLKVVPEPTANPALAASLPASSPASENHVSCYKLGPIINHKNYQALINQLKGTDSSIKLINLNEQKADGYIVYLPTAKKPKNPDAYLLMLKQFGLKDFYMVKTGEYKGQITLGTFTTEARALVLQKNLAAKGINASIKTQNKNKNVQYAMLRTSINVMGNLEALKKTYQQFVAIQVPETSAECL